MQPFQAFLTNPRSLRWSSGRRRACRRRRAGAAVVELALLLPLLVLLFVLAADFARIFYCSLTLTSCARAGALYASDPGWVGESPFSSAEAAALAEAANLVPPPTITMSTGADYTGQPYVAATAAYTFTTITSFPGIPKRFDLTRTVRVSVAPTIPDTN